MAVDTAANDAPEVVIAPPPDDGGTEISVNTTTAGYQHTAKTAAFADGSFVVTWVSQGQDGSGGGVYGQRFDAAGTKLGSEFRVNTTVAADQYDSSVAALAGGGFVVSWTSDGQDGSGDGIYAQLFDAAATPLGGEFLVNTETLDRQRRSSVTALDGGGFVVTWDSSGQDGSEYGVYAQLFNADGTRSGSEFRINATADSTQSASSITALDGGGFAATWVSFQPDGADADVFMQRFAADGTSVGTETQVNTYTASGQDLPRIARLSNGSFVIAWNSLGQDVPGGHGVYAQIFAADGTPIGGEFRANTTIDNIQADAAIAPLANGDFVIAWMSSGQDGSGYGIYAQRFAADGTKRGNEYVVNLTTVDNQRHPWLAPLSGGGFVAAWESESQDGDAGGIYARRYLPGFVAIADHTISLKGTLSVSDVDAGDAVVTATLTVDYGVLTVTEGGSGATVSSGNGTGSVVISGTIAQLNALFGSDAASSVDFTAGGGSPPPTATLTLAVDDGGATGPGGAQTGSASAAIAIVPDALPVANPDTAATGEDSPVSVVVVANDTDADGDTKTVVEINGSAVTIGSTVTLASGATVTLTAEGTIAYDPNDQFDDLVSPASAVDTGATNTSAQDSFTYSLNGGSTTTVTVTITGANDPEDPFHGDSGANTITDGDGRRYFDLSQGGDDTASGNGGNDAFYFGAAFTAKDTVDGGDGDNDQVGLEGNYTGDQQLMLAAATLTNVEVLAVLPGFDYSITTVDANVPAGGTLTVFAGNLGPDDSFVFNGSAETDGAFSVFGGRGPDAITTGAGDDWILFGPGKFDPLVDRVDGGANGATGDTLLLDGDYTLTLDGVSLVGIETVGLAAGIPGDLSDYVLTLADSFAGAGQAKTISGVALTTALVVDGSAETDGTIHVIGGAAADTLTGGAEDDSLFGRLGGDTLTGGLGADQFSYFGEAESSGADFDRLVGFDDDTDYLQVMATSFAAPVSGSLDAATMGTTLEVAFAALGPGAAGVFTATGGDMAGRTFLLVDAVNAAGYQHGGDYLFEMVAPVTPIDNLAMFT